MNKFENLLTDAASWQTLLQHFYLFTLGLNDEISKRFPDSKRTGQCASFLAKGPVSIGGYHVPYNQTDKKLRYLKNAHNKLIFLIENEDRTSTAPIDQAEKEKLEKEFIWRGGVRLADNTLITTSGFYPVVDEAHSLVQGLALQNFEGTPAQWMEQREVWMKEHAIKFQNPYALALGSMVNYIKTVKPEEAMQWGLKEIGEHFV